MTELELIGLVSVPFIAGCAATYAAMSATLDRAAGKPARAPTAHVTQGVRTPTLAPKDARTTFDAGPVMIDVGRRAPREDVEYRFPIANNDGTTRTLIIPIKHLRTFITCPTPKRDIEWRGDVRAWTACLDVAKSRGWIAPDPERPNGWKWVRAMATTPKRIEQFRVEGMPLA
jgi:hypothetical protein